MQETWILNVCNCIWLSRFRCKDPPAGKYNYVALICVKKSALCHFGKYYISLLLLCNFRLSSPIEQPVSKIQENNRCCYSVVSPILL